MNPSRELSIIGENCDRYKSLILISTTGVLTPVSCSTCSNWNGEKCLVNVYDSVKSFVQREDLI